MSLYYRQVACTDYVGTDLALSYEISTQTQFTASLDFSTSKNLPMPRGCWSSANWTVFYDPFEYALYYSYAMIPTMILVSIVIAYGCCRPCWWSNYCTEERERQYEEYVRAHPNRNATEDAKNWAMILSGVFAGVMLLALLVGGSVVGARNNQLREGFCGPQYLRTFGRL
jgi:hypothetical protein